MDTLTFYPNRQIGLIIGAVGLVLFIGLDVVFLLLLPQPPLGFVNFVWGLLLVLSLPPIGLLAYRTYGVWRSAYRLDRETLTIDWGARREVIPLREIKETLRGREIDTDLRPGGVWWPGCLVGRLKNDRLGEIEFMATMPQDAQLYLVTEGGGLAVSPGALDEFVAAFEERRQQASAVSDAGAAGESHRQSIRPSFLAWQVWRDRWAWVLLAASVIGVGTLFAYVLLRLPSLPVTMPLHFEAGGQGTPDRIGAPRGLLLLPLIGLLTLLVNSVLGGALHVRRERGQRAAAYMLWGTALFVQVLVWIAALALILRA